ncbi:glutamine-fructose-6-phosphate transaminase [Cavenderia fasciculata]|uniref:Glutamine--fructose-6-phosphate aminotransferase [isomerizing] n=1 Tax=Cavenderia fasciculata TaxID=261658 RepID=F4PKY1_CACFS|nr:glutamine-fructose-6-phosphate transaminase [Cavenderia fasciculata]EGG23203.1 glutamine-fructose-6-phosphate transaminase [Cavenderia fasciculata]|eukprot:XP_004361054.1 glutamine-fructose-6-phosphate transaminase [Cavenderia fasciculata]
MDESVLRRLQITNNHIQQQSNDSPLESNDTCGIIGFVGKEEAFNYLIEGLSILENRGYDSAGVTTISSNSELVTSKYASLNTTSDAISRLKTVSHLHKGHIIGIAHTRWATHGGKTDRNAHPHHDDKNRVAVVHNGVIENSSALREEIEKRGVVFRSETDTEVIAQLIGVFLDQGFPIIEAVKETQKKLQGTWGVACVCRDVPDQIIALKNGSPLLIGIGKDRALKIKEITYIHAEGYSGGALKHGPFALIEQGTPIILIILDDAHAQLMRIAGEEVKARGAYTIVITNQPALAKHVGDDVVVIPSNGVLTSLLAAIPLQLIAYEVAVLRGIDPDKPRNLAKAVTTD